MCIHLEEVQPSYWLKEYLEYKADDQIYIKDLYKFYEEVVVDQGVVPFTKRRFCAELRKLYKNDIHSRKVKIVNNKGLLIKGVNIKNNE